MDVWTITAEERAKHDSQFATLTHGPFITGKLCPFCLKCDCNITFIEKLNKINFFNFFCRRTGERFFYTV